MHVSMCVYMYVHTCVCVQIFMEQSKCTSECMSVGLSLWSLLVAQVNLFLLTPFSNDRSLCTQSIPVTLLHLLKAWVSTANHFPKPLLSHPRSIMLNFSRICCCHSNIHFTVCFAARCGQMRSFWTRHKWNWVECTLYPSWTPSINLLPRT